MIVIARKQEVADLEKLQEKKNFSLPMAPDPKREIYDKYASKYIPRNFVVGKDGKIKLVSTQSPEGRVEAIYQAIKYELEKKE